MTLNALAPRRMRLSLFADRSTQRWVVRDSDNRFWSLPMSDGAWDQREPYELTAEAELEPVPGHYLVLLGLGADSTR